MKAKADLSRLVMVTWSPSEAAVLVGVLEVFRRSAEGLEAAERRVVEHTMQRIMLQLKTLHWPLDQAKRAPYPL